LIFILGILGLPSGKSLLIGFPCPCTRLLTASPQVLLGGLPFLLNLRLAQNPKASSKFLMRVFSAFPSCCATTTRLLSTEVKSPPYSTNSYTSINFTTTNGTDIFSFDDFTVADIGQVNPAAPTEVPLFGPLGLFSLISGLIWFGRRRKQT